MTKYLGLDVGNARIGVAISDPNGTYSIPLTTIERRSIEEDIIAIKELATNYRIEDAIIVGIPISLKGSITIQTEITLNFCVKLSMLVDYQLVKWNESNTTIEAERLIKDSGKKPSKNRAIVDATAASIILQDYINHLKN